MLSIGYRRLLDPGETEGQARAKLLAALRETETVIEGKVTKPGHPHHGKKVRWQDGPAFTVVLRADPDTRTWPSGRPEVGVTRAYEVLP